MMTMIMMVVNMMIMINMKNEEDCQPFLPNSSNIPTVFASVRVRSEITLTPPPFVPEVNKIDLKRLPDVVDSKLTILLLYCGRTLWEKLRSDLVSGKDTGVAERGGQEAVLEGSEVELEAGEEEDGELLDQILELDIAASLSL